MAKFAEFIFAIQMSYSNFADFFKYHYYKIIQQCLKKYPEINKRDMIRDYSMILYDFFCSYISINYSYNFSTILDDIFNYVIFNYF